MSFNTVIVDDEQNSVVALQKLLEIYCPDLNVVQTFNDPRLALEYIIKEKPDLIFLDIQMPFMTGIDLLKKIPKENNAHIIFTTAYDQYAIDAIKLSALDYLLKPIDVEDLQNAVRKFINSTNKEDEKEKLQFLLDNFQKSGKKKLVVQLQSKTLFLNIAQIIFLQADSNYTTINMDDGSAHFASKTVKYFQEKLEHHSFFRPHQSYLINTNYIREYDKSDNKIVLQNNVTIPVSKNKKEALINMLTSL